MLGDCLATGINRLRPNSIDIKGGDIFHKDLLLSGIILPYVPWTDAESIGFPHVTTHALRKGMEKKNFKNKRDSFHHPLPLPERKDEWLLL